MYTNLSEVIGNLSSHSKKPLFLVLIILRGLCVWEGGEVRSKVAMYVHIKKDQIKCHVTSCLRPCSKSFTPP